MAAHVRTQRNKNLCTVGLFSRCLSFILKREKKKEKERRKEKKKEKNEESKQVFRQDGAENKTRSTHRERNWGASQYVASPHSSHTQYLRKVGPEVCL